MPDNDLKIDISKIEKIEIYSNCALLRPTIFTYKVIILMFTMLK